MAVLLYMDNELALGIAMKYQVLSVVWPQIEIIDFGQSNSDTGFSRALPDKMELSCNLRRVWHPVDGVFSQSE